MSFGKHFSMKLVGLDFLELMLYQVIAQLDIFTSGFRGKIEKTELRPSTVKILFC